MMAGKQTKRLPLQPDILEQLKKIGGADVILGTPSYKEADNIARIVKQGSDGFVKYFGDKKAVKPLLAKWAKEPAAGAPGTRYIPDVLAAIGDRSVVAELIKPLKQPLIKPLKKPLNHEDGICGRTSFMDLFSKQQVLN